MTDVPATHWLIDDYYDPDPRARDKTYAKRGAFLPEVSFDPLAWGVPPSNVPATDTNQLLALIVAHQVLEDAAGARLNDLPRDRISVILGCTSAQELLGAMVSRLQRPIWAKALRAQGLSDTQVAEACDRIAAHYVEWQETTFPGLLGNVVAGRIANRLNLGGTNCVTDAACASSLSALAMAVSELRLGDSDLVITGGADTMNDVFMYVCFSKTPALSPTGDCRPFSDRADGTMLGEGIGMVALKRLDDAERDRNHIYALIRGVGASSDGRAKSVYAPLAAGQAVALRRAYDQAGYGPDTVALVEAHGTGTAAGDAAELEALRTVFDESGRVDRGWCALGSVKSQIGHTKAAAGAAGLFKATMALAHKVLPPTIKVDRPDPKLAIETTPFYLNTALRPWISDGRHPRRASVSSFGFGGSNFHVALEEYTGPAPRPPRTRPAGLELVLLGGASGSAIAARCRELSASAAVPGMLSFMARSTQLAFDAACPARLAVFVASEAELAAKLARAAEVCERGQDIAVPGALAFATGACAGDVGFVFPGQGSQYLEMCGDIATTYEVARRVWDRARQIDLVPGHHLDDVVYPRAAFDDATRDAQLAQLTATQWAQPAIGATSLALLAVVRELGLVPAAVAGHSFGELTALCAAGALSADDLLRAARRRGELMARASAIPGAMISVTGRVDEARQLLASSGLGVVIANHNSPHQIVLSGALTEIAELEPRLAAAGIASTRLPVATAFHSALVSSASAPFREFLAAVELGAPAIDVYGNASAAPYPSDPDAIRDTLARQLTQPVRFVEQIEAMYARGIRVFVEIGPGNVLTHLIERILEARPHTAVAMNRKGRAGLACLHEALGTLSVAGVALDYRRLGAELAAVDDPRAAPVPAMTMKLCGAAYGKPYPPAPSPRPPTTIPAAPSRPATPEPAMPTHTTDPGSREDRLQAASPAAPVGGDPDVQLAWVHAFQESQRQTAESHAAFQRAMTDSHAAFLRSTESSLNGLVAILTGAPAAASGAAPRAIVVAAEPDRNQAAVSIPPAPVPAPLAPAPAVATPVRAAPPTPGELQALALRVVAACTGYPAEMLGLDMDLEADLGVDSIKRVEILAALTEQAPSLPEVSSAELAAKRTLRQILAYFEAVLGPPGGDGGGPPPRGRHAAGGLPPAGSDSMPPPHGSSASGPPVSGTRGAAERLARHAVRAVAAAATGLGVPGLLDARRVAITDDGAGVASALAARLVAAGAVARVVDQVPGDADAVILLDGLRAVHGLADAIAVQRAAFQSARAVAPRFTSDGGTFITVQDTGGDFGLRGSEAAWIGGIAGLAKTCALEWPRAHVRAIDIERGGRSPAAIADAVWWELLEGTDHREVGLRATGARAVLELQRAPLAPAGELRVAPGAVVIASGGARGVTAACVIALAEATRARFVLLGRTAVTDEPLACRGITGDAELKRALLAAARDLGHDLAPAALGRAAAEVRAAREIGHTIAAIRAAGGDARYEAVDITDAAAVARAAATARAWGPIAGIVHGAGVRADKRIADKTCAQFDLVVSTKVAGLGALLDATRADDLAFVVAFSSVAGRLGNPGQADYAMANEVLNKVCVLEQHRRGERCRVRAIGWGPWDGGMVDDGLRAHFAARGVPLIALAAGAQQLCDELAAPASADAEVVIGGLAERAAAGRGALVGDVVADVVADVVIDRARHGFLDGHRIKGVAVLPVALALEWFARAVSQVWPDPTAVAIRGLRVLRGVRLTGFDGDRVERLVVRARPIASSGELAALALELAAPDGTKHYTATAERSDGARPAAATDESNALVAWPGSPYGPHGLFHGAGFRVIERIDGVSDRGMAARLVGVANQSWGGSWLLDPALLDGGLQLAVIWTRHTLGRASLPTAIDSLRVFAPGPARGAVQCIVSGREAQGDRATCDVSFLDGERRVIAVLRGVETHALPSHPANDVSSPYDAVVPAVSDAG